MSRCRIPFEFKNCNPILRQKSTLDDFHQNLKLVFEFDGYFFDVAGINVHVDISIVERLSFGDVAVILSNMRRLFVPEFHQGLFLVLESLAVLLD